MPEEIKNLSESSNIEDSPSETQEKSTEEIKTMPRKSRLNKSFQRKSRNTFILSILGIIIVLALLFKFGLPLISDASFLFGKVTSTPDKNSDKDVEEEFVPVPTLDGLPKATKEKALKITGSSISGVTIQIYLNGSKETDVKADENGDFEGKVILSDGDNIIKIKAVKGTTESDFSPSETVSYKIKGPDLTINSPSDGSQISGANPIEVKGKSDPDGSVIVNDFQAIINNNGEWSYMLTLKGGDNEIKVVSTDAAGNTTEKIIHVNYAQ
jgi:hypothetical protein